MQAIVNSILANNPGRTIPSSKVRGFATREAANAFMITLVDKVSGALHFDINPVQPSSISFTLQANTTVSLPRQPIYCKHTTTGA